VSGLAVLAAAVLPAWSPPAHYDPPSCRDCVTEPAPRVAVNARGEAAAVWVDPRGRVRVALAARPGRFGAAATLAARGLRPSAAVGPDGAVTVVWQGAHETLRFARRPAGASRFGASRPLAPGDDATPAAEPGGAAEAVYEDGGHVAAIAISPSGAPGAAVRLGAGGFDRDSTRAAPDGTLAACCIQPVVDDPNVPPDTAEKIAVYRPASGWSLVPAVGHDAIETVFATATELILGTVQVRHRGDAGATGVPGLARLPAAPLRAPVENAGSGLTPNVAIDGSGRSVLVFQEKRRPAAFSRMAPVYASVAAPDATALNRTRLDASQAYEPAVRPLGSGALAVWQRPKASWGVALETTGVFHRIAGPRGPGPTRLGEDFNYAYDVQAAGPYAVLTWVAADGSVRVSELR
jgi:hypothetical protein